MTFNKAFIENSIAVLLIAFLSMTVGFLSWLNAGDKAIEQTASIKTYYEMVKIHKTQSLLVATYKKSTTKDPKMFTAYLNASSECAKFLIEVNAFPEKNNINGRKIPFENCY